MGEIQSDVAVAHSRRRPRRRVTTRRQDRYIVLSHLHDRRMTAASTARRTTIHNRPASNNTIANRLREAGKRARRPMRVPILLPRHRAARLAWAIRHLRFTRADWAYVLFVDETKIKLSGSACRLRVYRWTGERSRNSFVLET